MTWPEELFEDDRHEQPDERGHVDTTCMDCTKPIDVLEGEPERCDTCKEAIG